MPTNSDTEDLNAQKVIARSLAYLALNSTDRANATLHQKAEFLGGLGLSVAEAAQMLGTTPASLRELKRQAKNAKGGKRGKARK